MFYYDRAYTWLGCRDTDTSGTMECVDGQPFVTGGSYPPGMAAYQWCASTATDLYTDPCGITNLNNAICEKPTGLVTAIYYVAHFVGNLCYCKM